jgi:hypothetical protein
MGWEFTKQVELLHTDVVIIFFCMLDFIMFVHQGLFHCGYIRNVGGSSFFTFLKTDSGIQSFLFGIYGDP